MFTYTPSSTAIASSPKDAQSRMRDLMGLSNTPADWQYQERNDYNKALASEMAAHPDIYGKYSEIAGKYKPVTGDLEQYGFFDMAGDFMGEAANQFQQVNPWSEKNRTESKVTLWLILAAVVIGGLAYLKFGRQAAT